MRRIYYSLRGLSQFCWENKDSQRRTKSTKLFLLALNFKADKNPPDILDTKSTCSRDNETLHLGKFVTSTYNTWSFKEFRDLVLIYLIIKQKVKEEMLGQGINNTPGKDMRNSNNGDKNSFLKWEPLEVLFLNNFRGKELTTTTKTNKKNRKKGNKRMLNLGKKKKWDTENIQKKNWGSECVCLYQCMISWEVDNFINQLMKLTAILINVRKLKGIKKIFFH